MNCDEHFVVVATKPDQFPGAYASCVAEWEHLTDWAADHLLDGATLRMVTCNEGHALMVQYVEWCDAAEERSGDAK
jgi:hypothetical protein